MGAQLRLILAAAICGLAAVALADTNGMNQINGLGQVFAGSGPSSPLLGRRVLVYWDPYKGDGAEKDNLITILQGAGATVTETSTTDPLTFASALDEKDVLVIAELLDGQYPAAGDLDMLDSRFTAFKPHVDLFLDGGGVAIVTEGDVSTTPGVQVINSLGYTAVTAGAGYISTVSLALDDPADPMLYGISSLSTNSGWMDFYSTDLLLNRVASYAGEYVLADKPVSDGWFGIIGFDYWSSDTNMEQALINTAAIPEPATAVLVALGLGVLLIHRRRRS